MTPSDCITAVATQIAALSPATRRSRRDRFRRVFSTAGGPLQDRQFFLQQTELPEEPEEWLASDWRWVGLELRIGYAGTPETDNRIAEDGEQILELCDSIDQSVAGIQEVDREGGGFVDYDDDTGAGEAVFALRVLYDKAV